MALSLHFENNGNDRQRVYHKDAKTGARTPAFDLNAILGNDDGKARWGLKGISFLAKDLSIHDGHILKGLLYQRSRKWEPVNEDLAKHIRLANGKNELESFEVPFVPKDEMEALEQNNEELRILLAQAEQAAAAEEKVADKEKKEADDALELERQAKQEKADWEKQNKAEDDARAADVAAHQQSHKVAQQEIIAKAVEEELASQERQAELQFENAATVVEGFIGSLMADAKAAAEEEEELRFAESRLQKERELAHLQKRLANQAHDISGREFNLSKTYGDHAWYDAELKERDLKMSFLFQESSELYRELSESHTKFSAVDKERLARIKEERHISRIIESVTEARNDRAAKLAKVTRECREREAEIKRTTFKKTRVAAKCTELEREIDTLRRENLALKTLTSDLKAERSAIEAKLTRARTTVAGQEQTIEHSKKWKQVYDEQVAALKQDIAEVQKAMVVLEEGYRAVTDAFRAAQSSKEKLQAELTALKYSKTAVDAEVLAVEQAIQETRTEISQLSKSFEERDREVRAMASAKAILERRLSELTLSHLHERNVTRSVSQRLFHVQGNLAENVDWTHDMRSDLTEESKYLYLHHLRHGGITFGEERPDLTRLPSYRTAVKQPLTNEADSINVASGRPGASGLKSLGMLGDAIWNAAHMTTPHSPAYFKSLSETAQDFMGSKLQDLSKAVDGKILAYQLSDVPMSTPVPIPSI